MQIGMLGLGRMGANMARRLIRGGHECVVFNRSPEAVAELVRENATGATTLSELVHRLAPPRHIWLMVPAAAVDDTIASLCVLLQPGDTIIDGGNSHYVDDIRRAEALEPRQLSYVDVGTSGGIWGLQRGYCLMIGGATEVVRRLDPVFRTLAPRAGTIEATPGGARGTSTAQEGYLHCGPNGAGHFVKMVHNGIEYGLMAAYAEGLNILAMANAGSASAGVDAETTPLRNPELFRFDMNLRDISELWRRGSVISSWLLDLAAAALAKDPALEGFSGRVSDSGEGRWTIQAAIEEGVPVPVLSAALYERFRSRGNGLFQDKLLSALRFEFGGHAERNGSP